MNEQITNALNWRYAVQTFDPSKKVSAGDFLTILESARLSPNSYGLEAWKFIVVENPELRAKLRGSSYGQSKVTDASHLIVIARRTDVRDHIVNERINRTATIQKQEPAALAGLKEMLDGTVARQTDESLDQWAKAQTYIALGMMMETASLLRIDNAAMEGFEPAKVDAILGLTAKHLASVTMLALGFRGDDPAAARPKVRRSFDEVVEFMK